MYKRQAFANMAQSEASIVAEFPVGPDDKQLEIMAPVWTPGSYLVREYAKNFGKLSAFSESGAELAMLRTRKNRWLVQLPTPNDIKSVRVVYPLTLMNVAFELTSLTRLAVC